MFDCCLPSLTCELEPAVDVDFCKVVERPNSGGLRVYRLEAQKVNQPFVYLQRGHERLRRRLRKRKNNQILLGFVAPDVILLMPTYGKR